MKRLAKAVIDWFGTGPLLHGLKRKAAYWLDAKTRAANAAFAAPDGMPLPPPELVYLVTDQFGLEPFYRSGELGAGRIRDILAKNGVDAARLGALLDFGCGCGRVLRQWKTLAPQTRVYGCDYNPRLIEWCRRSLTFAEFSVNGAEAPLSYPSESFDFVYCISVFTHLTEAGQDFWLAELKRIIRPGGHLLVTLHGTSRAGQLTEEERRRFDAGQLVVVRDQYPGSNLCGAFHPEPYVRDRFGRSFAVVDYLPGGAWDAAQDAVLLRK
jgi:SAM-dependent methyltransferase